MKPMAYGGSYVFVGDEGSGNGFRLRRMTFLGNEMMFEKVNYENPLTPFPAVNEDENCVGRYGIIRKMVSLLKVEDFVRRTNEMMELFKRPVMKKPFLTMIDRGLVVTSDGKRGVLTWSRNGTTVFNPDYKINRSAKWPWDVVAMSDYGEPALPVRLVFDRIRENIDVFADPFAMEMRGDNQFYILKDKKRRGLKLKKKVKTEVPNEKV